MPKLNPKLYCNYLRQPKLTMREGIIISYNHAKRVGFIKDLSGQRLKFLNESAVTLKRNDVVNFALAILDGMIVAIDIKIIAVTTIHTTDAIKKLKD